MTLPAPEEKANYVHRIGRVGRAERYRFLYIAFRFSSCRMGLAISLVSSVNEKVWYHQCKSRGVGCFNTRLVAQGGCTKWLSELTVNKRVVFLN